MTKFSLPRSDTKLYSALLSNLTKTSEPIKSKISLSNEEIVLKAFSNELTKIANPAMFLPKLFKSMIVPTIIGQTGYELMNRGIYGNEEGGRSPGEIVSDSLSSMLWHVPWAMGSKYLSPKLTHMADNAKGMKTWLPNIGKGIINFGETMTSPQTQMYWKAFEPAMNKALGGGPPKQRQLQIPEALQAPQSQQYDTLPYDKLRLLDPGIVSQKYFT